MPVLNRSLYYYYSIIIILFTVTYCTSDHLSFLGNCQSHSDDYCESHIRNSICNRIKNECFCRLGFVAIRENNEIVCRPRKFIWSSVFVLVSKCLCFWNIYFLLNWVFVSIVIIKQPLLIWPIFSSKIFIFVIIQTVLQYFDSRCW